MNKKRKSWPPSVFGLHRKIELTLLGNGVRKKNAH